jgi:MFS family permease
MFLTFAVNGAWNSTLAKYLKDLRFGEMEINLILNAGAVANLLLPLLAGQAVDRWFAAQRFLAFGYLGTALFLLAAYTQTAYAPLLALIFGAQLFYVTTLPLGTALAFHHLEDGPRQFPKVRLWGTVGWVAGAASLSGWLYLKPGRGLGDGLALAGLFALLNAAWSLTLPHTPPRRDAVRKLALGPVLEMLRQPSFAFFIALMFVLQVCTTFYFTRAPVFLHHVGVSDRDLGAVISLGQVVEVFVIFVMPRVQGRLGFKGTIALGIAAWAARYGIFALGGPPWLVIASLALHGPCFAFGRIAPTMYVQHVAPEDVRASAQSFLSLVMEGAGVFLGVLGAGFVSARLTSAAGTEWTPFWLLPGTASGVVLILFLAFFRPRR